MNTLELMDASISRYSKTDRAIYEAIRKFPDSYATQSVTQISEAGHFSKPALTRFAQRLGFGGFVEFQFQLRQDIERVRKDEQPTNAKVYADLLLSVDDLIDRDQLSALAERMVESPHVFLMGSNLSRLPAEELGMALIHRPEVFAVYQQQDILYNYQPEDLLVLYSASNGHAFRHFAENLSAHAGRKPYAVLVTTNSRHPLRKHFDEMVVLPTAPLSSSTSAVLSDTFSFLMFNDMIVSALGEARA